ncbi:MAG: hypothetical protein NTW07_02130 [candidate division Zixibacteria bacterium]|nr:hypothetical protein [candidate division Zixibacteria bacterium]
MSWFRNDRLSDNKSAGSRASLTAQIDEVLSTATDPRTAFSEFSRLMESTFDIRKGFLALREKNQTRFLAIASWKKGGERRSLSLLLPQTPSLFEKVAENGQIYSETFAEFFDGNRIERSLLFDDDTVSFMLRPLKHEARVVGLIGYSSDISDAFVTIEDGQLDPAFDRLATFLGRLQPSHVST